MLYDAIFISLFVAGWLFCGFLPWLVLSVATRGHAGLPYLPLSLFAGVVGGLAVPVLGLTGVLGLRLSFVAAIALPSALVGARRLSQGVAERSHAASNQPSQPREEQSTH